MKRHLSFLVFSLLLANCSKLNPGSAGGRVALSFSVGRTATARLAVSTFSLRSLRLTCGGESLRLPIDGFSAQVPWGSSCAADQIEILGIDDIFDCSGTLQSPGDSVPCVAAVAPGDRFDLVFQEGLPLSPITAGTTVVLDVRNRSRSGETTPVYKRLTGPAQPVGFQISAALSVSAEALAFALEYDAVTTGFSGSVTIGLLSENDPPADVDLSSYTLGGSLDAFQGNLAWLSPSAIASDGSFTVTIGLSPETARRLAELTAPEEVVLTLNRGGAESTFRFRVHPPVPDDGDDSSLGDLNPGALLPSKAFTDELRAELGEDAWVIDETFPAGIRLF